MVPMNYYISRTILKKKSAEVDDHRSTGLVYVRVRLVSRSHFTSPKMADPVNVWNLPINFFLALEV